MGREGASNLAEHELAIASGWQLRVEGGGFQAAQKKCPIHVRIPCIRNEVAIQASAELVVACQAGAARTAEGSEKNDGEEPDSPDETQGLDVSQADQEAETQELRQKRRKVQGP